MRTKLELEKEKTGDFELLGRHIHQDEKGITVDQKKCFICMSSCRFSA